MRRAPTIAITLVLLVAAAVSIGPALAADKVRAAVERANRAWLDAYAAHY